MTHSWITLLGEKTECIKRGKSLHLLPSPLIGGHGELRPRFSSSAPSPLGRQQQNCGAWNVWLVCLPSLFFCPLKVRTVTSQMGMLSITTTLAAEQWQKCDAAGACSKHQFLVFLPANFEIVVHLRHWLRNPIRTVICDARWYKT